MLRIDAPDATKSAVNSLEIIKPKLGITKSRPKKVEEESSTSWGNHVPQASHGIMVVHVWKGIQSFATVSSLAEANGHYLTRGHFFRPEAAPTNLKKLEQCVQNDSSSRSSIVLFGGFCHFMS